MTGLPQLLDTVAVRADLPDLGLTAGEVGAVVEELSGGAFEVEFVGPDGDAYAVHALRASQIVALHTRGQALRLSAGRADAAATADGPS